MTWSLVAYKGKAGEYDPKKQEHTTNGQGEDVFAEAAKQGAAKLVDTYDDETFVLVSGYGQGDGQTVNVLINRIAEPSDLGKKLDEQEQERKADGAQNATRGATTA